MFALFEFFTKYAAFIASGRSI